MKKDKPNPLRDRTNDKTATINRLTWYRTQAAQAITGRTRKEIYEEAIADWCVKEGIDDKVEKIVKERERAMA